MRFEKYAMVKIKKSTTIGNPKAEDGFSSGPIMNIKILLQLIIHYYC